MEKKKRSVKRKAQAPLESSLAIRGKILRLGASSSSSTAKEWGLSNQVPARGQVPQSYGRGVQGGGSEKSFEEERQSSSGSPAHFYSESPNVKLQAPSYDARGRGKELLRN